MTTTTLSSKHHGVDAQSHLAKDLTDVSRVCMEYEVRSTIVGINRCTERSPTHY